MKSNTSVKTEPCDGCGREFMYLLIGEGKKRCFECDKRYLNAKAVEDDARDAQKQVEEF